MTASTIPENGRRYLDTRAAFDGVADAYQGPLGNNRLVQQMREVLWREVCRVAVPGTRLLDLGCGTGHDAVYFARKGYSVTAIDWSAAMVAQTRRNAGAVGIGERVRTEHLGIQELDRVGETGFGCIYSDLGALNCISDLEAVSRCCATLLQPGGALVFSVIGRYCPWELAHYGLRGNFTRMRVRFARVEVPVGLNGGTVWTRYYTPAEFFRPFSERFAWRRCRALNLFAPPPYLLAPFENYPRVLGVLGWLDTQLGGLPLLNRAGDHFLLVMSRREGDHEEILGTSAGEVRTARRTEFCDRAEWNSALRK